MYYRLCRCICAVFCSAENLVCVYRGFLPTSKRFRGCIQVTSDTGGLCESCITTGDDIKVDREPNCCSSAVYAAKERSCCIAAGDVVKSDKESSCCIVALLLAMSSQTRSLVAALLLMMLPSQTICLVATSFLVMLPR